MFNFMQTNQINFKSLPCLTISYINGPAFGGGSELTSWTDLRISNQNTKVSFAHKHMGLITSWNGGINLAGIVGKSRALEMMVTAGVYDGEKLVEMGYVNEQVDDHVDCPIENENVQKLLKTYKGRSIQQSHAFKACMDPKIDQLDLASSLFGEELNVKSIDRALERVVKKK